MTHKPAVPPEVSLGSWADGGRRQGSLGGPLGDCACLGDFHEPEANARREGGREPGAGSVEEGAVEDERVLLCGGEEDAAGGRTEEVGEGAHRFREPLKDEREGLSQEGINIISEHPPLAMLSVPSTARLAPHFQLLGFGRRL